MFEAWLLVTALLCYAVVAYLWSPPTSQFQKEFDDAERVYSQRQTPVARIGLAVNRAHYMVVTHRGIAVTAIAVTWLVVTAVWTN